MKRIFNLLAIETSCDETAAAVIEFDKGGHIKPLSSVVASQIDLHKKYGGVFPELASRAHSQKILPVAEAALHAAQARNPKSEIRNKPEYQEFKYSNIKNLDIVSNFDIRYSNLSTVLKSIDAIAVTTGPGLVGSLIVGVEFARGLAAALDIPVVPVNHLEGHIFAACGGVSTKFQAPNSKQILNSKNQSSERVCDLVLGACDLPPKPDFPLLALVVSGGHTLLVKINKLLDYEIIGTTLDDAAGEAFDKVARMLDLPYPGGPEISRLAEKGNPRAFDFPRSMLKSGDNNFSFSGLKTAVFYKLRELGLVDTKAEPIISQGLGVGSREQKHPAPTSQPQAIEALKASIAASFQAAVIDVLIAKTFKAAAKIGARSIVIGGGVAANSALRSAFILKSKILNLKSCLSPKTLATDNALTIAIAGAHRFLAGDTISWQSLEADANQKLI